MKKTFLFALFLGAWNLPVLAQGYPEHSRRLDEEGDVTLGYKLGAAGVTDCRVIKGSGFPRLDEASCPLLLASLKNQTGSDTAERHNIVRWRLPSNEVTEAEDRSGRFPTRLPDQSRGVNFVKDGELPAGRRENLALYISVDVDGSVENCSVRWGSSNPQLDDRACEVARSWRYLPVMKKGAPIKAKIPETFYWASADAPIPAAN